MSILIPCSTFEAVSGPIWRICDIPRVLVIGGETGGVGGLGDLAINNLLQGVDALAVRAEGVLEV